MENRSHALAAGLFAIFLGAATLVAVWWFSGQHQVVKSYELVAEGNVTGLNPQAQVRYRGMSAGKVTDIRIDPDDPRNILVDIEVQSDIPITHGTVASLGTQGVTGLAFVQLDDRGDDPRPLEADDDRPPRIPLKPGLMDQLTHTAFDVVHRFKEVAEQVSGFFDEDNVERFDATLKHLEAASAGVDETFEEAPKTLAAIRAALSDENIQRLSKTLVNLEQATDEAGPAMREIRELIARADSTMRTLDSVAMSAGDTLIEGTLPQLNALLEDLTQTSSRLGKLIDDVEASPQILLTGHRDRRPGPGEPGFDSQRQR